MAGQYAYIAAAKAGLQVIDVSDPTNPQRLGGCDAPDNARAVADSGNFASVADGEWGLQIFRFVNTEPSVQRLDGTFGLTAEGFEAWLDAPAAGTYRVENSGDLRSWESLVTLSDVAGRVRVVDPAASGAALRFFRAVRVP